MKTQLFKQNFLLCLHLLWSTGQLGAQNVVSFQNTIRWRNTIFCVIGRQETHTEWSGSTFTYHSQENALSFSPSFVNLVVTQHLIGKTAPHCLANQKLTRTFQMLLNVEKSGE